VSFGEFALLEGAAPTAFGPRRKEALLDLRKAMREDFGEITAEALHEASAHLREVYFALRDRELHPTLPQLANTDGDPLEFHKLNYEVESADAAFEALRSLAEGQAEEEVAAKAVRAADGRLQSAEFPWTRRGNPVHKSWENTILGSIRIEGTSLTVEVNSARRARKIESEVRKRLVKRAKLLGTEVRSMEEAMAERKGRPATPEEEEQQRQSDRLRADPEVQAHLRRMMEAHMESWVDEKLPILGGKTPRQAGRAPDGREMVEALLLEMEGAARRGAPAVDVDKVRERLGLARGPGEEG
jgi:hypothetical protein